MLRRFQRNNAKISGGVMSGLGLLVVVVVLAAATGCGLLRRRHAGRMRAARSAPRLTADVVGGQLGERATLLQFSSAFCRPCVATRHVLSDVAGRVDGVRHVDVDAESHLELVRALGIASTPTTLLLDGDGVVRNRAVGVPRKDDLLAALSSVVG